MEPEMTNTLRLALLLSLLCAPAQAGEKHTVDQRDIEVGDALVCDTQEQAERYIALYKGDQDEALSAVNAEANNPTACGVMSIAFIRGPHVATGRNADMAFDVVRILVLGVDGSAGIRDVRPAAYFTIFGVTEYDV
jgi:hypothetical protein